MKTITETKQIVGVLHTLNGDYDLLDLSPVKKFVPVPDTHAFYVTNILGYATHVLVKGDFVIEQYTVKVEKEVEFVLEEEEPATIPVE